MPPGDYSGLALPQSLCPPAHSVREAWTHCPGEREPSGSAQHTWHLLEVQLAKTSHLTPWRRGHGRIRRGTFASGHVVSMWWGQDSDSASNAGVFLYPVDGTSPKPGESTPSPGAGRTLGYSPFISQVRKTAPRWDGLSFQRAVPAPPAPLVLGRRRSWAPFLPRLSCAYTYRAGAGHQGVDTDGETEAWAGAGQE